MDRVIVPAGVKASRVDSFLAAARPGTSRGTIQRWIKEGRVSICGRPCKPKDKVWPGAILEVEPGPPPPSRAEPDASVKVDVLFHDEHLIVVNKPAGLVVHPGRGHYTGTLVNGLLATEGFGVPPADELDPDGLLRPGIVHRIDKDTSGVLVVAKDIRAREGLKAQFAEHTIERSYVALVQGRAESRAIETLHGRHPTQRIKFTSKCESGKKAVTHIQQKELFGRFASRVSCRLETGRTHQIRVHLVEQMGTPILADSVYGRGSGFEVVRAIEQELGRQALHASRLGFVHPLTQESMVFEVPLPADMQRALDRLRALTSS